MASSYSSLFRRRWAVIAILVGVALSGYFGWRHFFAEGAAAVANSDQRPVAIPVTIALAQKADFPVYLNGLGTVEPYDTVTVRSRVDGEITKVDFKQGQMVKEGDLLVQIDPRPYQAALDQALAKKAQDEANLKNAQLNLQRYQHPRQGGIRLAPAARHAAGHGRSAQGADQGRPGGDRQRPDPARLRDHPLAAHRAKPASASSTPAISCMRPTPPAS